MWVLFGNNSIDLDGFKAINDTHGHDAGDSLLINISTRMVDNVRRGDIVGRLAGDEFVILCEQIEQSSEVAGLADRLNDALRQPIPLANGVQVCVAASIGVALGHGSSHSVDDLLRNADTAMYAVKLGGRDSWQFFNDGLEEKARQRMSLISNLRLALERNEFSLRYQPIVVIEGRRTIGAEALLRWHPPSGEISPGIFVPVAESMGMIASIGLWVFRHACLTAAHWRAHFGDDTPYVAVNVSTRQLDEPGLVEQFASILYETGVKPSDLLLEITETALMSNIESNVRTLHRLAQLGPRVAVDDFGTGYSSLAQLLRLPLSVVKIDRAFIDRIDTQHPVRVVASAIIRMTQTLGHQVVAEGVETEAQLGELRTLGCDYAQGYLFARPLLAEEMFEFIHHDRNLTHRHPTHPIFYLLYVSEAAQPFDANRLDDLMKQSRQFNHTAGLTGCLIYQDNQFMQIIEGERAKVETLMAKIQHDPRHKNLQIIAQGDARCRMFPEWSMHLRDLNTWPNPPEFLHKRKRTIPFAELAEDPNICYVYITAFLRTANA